jgi:DNA helicase-2/ATP-dependent DNA helicase PcrA
VTALQKLIDNVKLIRVINNIYSSDIVGDKAFEFIEGDEFKRLDIVLSDFIDRNVFIHGEKYSVLIDVIGKLC